MSWRQTSGEFDPHGGRNAFRGGADLAQTSSEKTLRAMRSFTESVEDDFGPPELPANLDIDLVEASSMKTSETNDTIIEVNKVDPQLGETQKYKMTVPGPGHSEQEQELHKSLIRDEEEDFEVELANAQKNAPPKSLNFDKEPTHDDIRREYNAVVMQRRRPTTPTSASVLDTFNFVAEEEEKQKKKLADEEKIKVSIPTTKRRKGEMTYSEFYESMAAQMPSQVRNSQSGRTTPLNDYEGDILEEHPDYKDKAPPAPVVHRRSSIEWENFADMEEKMQLAEAKEADEEEKKKKEKDAKKLSFSAKAPTVEITSPDAPHTGAFHDPRGKVEEEDEDDEEPPSFSEDMQEERTKVPEAIEPTYEQPSQEESQEESQAYDPNAYPGYTWNYETQEWEVDPNYDHSLYSAGYDQPTEAEVPQAEVPQAVEEYDYSAYGGYEGYLEACKAYEEANGQAYDPQAYGQEQQAYDQQAYSHDQQAYGHQAYDSQAYSQAYGQDSQAYDQQAYSQSQQAYDPQAYSQDQQAYSQHQQAYSQEQQQAYDPQSYAHDQQAYSQDQQAYSHDQQVYSQDQQAYSQDQQTYSQDYQSTYQGYDQGYDHSAIYSGYDQSTTDQTYEYTNGNSEESHQEPPPRPPAFTTPLFQQVKEEDPYAWGAAPPVAQHQLPAPEEEEVEQHVTPARPAPPGRPEPPKETAAPPRPPAATRSAPPRPAAAKKPEPANEPEPEEDAWAQFKKMTEKVSSAVKSSESTLKNLEETTAVKDIKDESYFAQIGGSQGFVNESTQREITRLEEEKKNEKLLKKKLKQQGKKAASPTFDPDEEDAMDRAAQELAIKLSQMRTDIGDWQKPELPPPATLPPPVERQDSASAIPPRKRSSLKEVQQDSGGSLELPCHLTTQRHDSVTPKGDLDPDDPTLSAPAWTDFESSDSVLPPSESGFFSNKDNTNEASSSETVDPFVTANIKTSTSATATTPSATVDPFAPTQSAFIDESYDPFAVRAVEDVVAMAKATAEQAAATNNFDDDFYGERQSPALSTPTPEGGSPISQRPNRFEDDFKCEGVGLETPTPLYDEDDSQPLVDFLPKFTGEGWELMIRHPIKKKSFMSEKFWKPGFVRLHGTTLLIYNDKNDANPYQELLLQATYSLSDTTLQAYDIYGKIHTVKLQFVVYKEKVGIRAGQINRLMDGHVTKYGLPLEHSAQCTVLMKFGSLNASVLQSFVTTIEDILFKCEIARTTKPIYKVDETQIHCYDEYSAFVDKDGVLSDQKARVRLFCLAFLTGSPFLEIGLNDRRRQGKEIVRRKDILPMHTERWIRFENLEFHRIVDTSEFDKEQVIRFSPPDGCFFEIMRFRVRPPRNREKAMTVKSIMKIAGSKVEIRIEAMAAAQIQRTRGGQERRTIPCEDILIRFPIPEAWIYIFREERHWGVGSVHSKKLRPGKVKNLKDRLLGAVQSAEQNLIECAIGEAKYEHVYRSLVWRIPRLPEKHHSAYKSHLLRARFELSSFDLMPEEFLPRCDVEFTMPLATVSNTVVRSVSVEQHEDSDRVEKFVRYVAKYNYKVEIDYVQCANLDLDLADPSVNQEAAAAPVPELHQPQFQPDTNKESAASYGIEFNEAEFGGRKQPAGDDSSSDDEIDSHKMPIIQIDMKNYGY